jgi:hypothetical protein
MTTKGRIRIELSSAVLLLMLSGCGPAVDTMTATSLPQPAPTVEMSETAPATATNEPTAWTFPGGTGTVTAKSTFASMTLTSQVITPSPTISPGPEYVWISSAGLKLRLSSRLGTSWVIGTESGSGEGYVWARPEHRFINVGCCEGLGDIRIIPIEEYERVASWFVPPLSDELDQWKELFEQRPAQLPFDLDFLPRVNAGTMMNAKPGYLDFQSGSGIRYLTVFHQDPLAVTNSDLLYVFQGLTTDGRYLVSGRFAIDNQLLPDDGLVPPTDVDYDTYLDQVVSELTQAESSSFEPDLTLLDEMMESLEVEQ